MNRFSQKTLEITIPDTFKEVLAKDTNVEMVVDDYAQLAKLHYSSNKMTHSVAFVFINEKCNSKYEDFSAKDKVLQIAQYFK